MKTQTTSLDALATRAKIAVIVPATNTIVQPEMEAMRPAGVTNHVSRMLLPVRPYDDMQAYRQALETERGNLEEALNLVLPCEPHAVAHGHSIHSFRGDRARAQAEQDRLRQEAIERAEREEAESELPNAREMGGNQNAGRDMARLTAEQRDAAVFDRWLRNGDRGLSNEDVEHIRSRPRADLSSGDAARGGYLAPADFSAQLLERLQEFGGVRQSGATVIQTSSGKIGRASCRERVSSPV